MHIGRLSTWLLVALTTLLAACGGGSGDGDGTQNQTLGFANAGPMTGEVGTTLTNAASGGAGTGAITYASSDAAVAAVDASAATVSLVSVGSATITATKAASSGFNQATASYSITVTRRTQTIAFTQPGPFAVLVGSVTQNVASGGNGTGNVTYASSNSNVVTVDPATGNATAIDAGTAIVTATKAADANYLQAQATYTINSQASDRISAFIGAAGAEVSLPASANGKEFARARTVDCLLGASVFSNILSCANVERSAVTGASVSDTKGRLQGDARYAIVNGTTVGTAIDVRAGRFSGRIGHAAVYFKNRYWVIAGGQPVFGAQPIQHTAKADVWSSADGRSWREESSNAGFGARWFPEAVVFNDRIWLIGGARLPVPPAPAVPWYEDVWSSADGGTWRRETTNAGLPWWPANLNVVVFNGEMLAVSGGRVYSSTNGVFTQKAGSATPALTGSTLGRTGASLTLYDDQLWYIGGKPDLPLGNPANGDGMNDVWRSSDGIVWTQVLSDGHGFFSPRYRHSSFVADGRLWVYGGQAVTTGVAGAAAGDAWSTTDGVTWTSENVSALARGSLMRAIQQPDKVTLIGGLLFGHADTVWQSTDGVNWAELSSNAQFSSRHTDGIAFNGQLWIVGGAGSGGAPADTNTNEIWRTGDGVNWTRVTTSGSIFTPRDGHELVVFNNRLWVIGGWNNPTNAPTRTRLNDVWSSADGVTWRLETAAAAFSPRVRHAALAFAGKLWVISGSGANSDVNDVWSSTDGVTWVQETANAAFPARVATRVVEFNNEMWLIGGGAPNGTNEIWHSSDGVTWTQFATTGPVFAPRTRHAATVLNGRVYVIGGVSNDTYATGLLYNDVWSSADGVSWRQETGAAPFPPRSQHALIPHNNELWVVAGFGVGVSNDVWRSSDGVSWRLGFSSDIAVP